MVFFVDSFDATVHFISITHRKCLVSWGNPVVIGDAIQGLRISFHYSADYRMRTHNIPFKIQLRARQRKFSHRRL